MSHNVVAVPVCKQKKYRWDFDNSSVYTNFAKLFAACVRQNKKLAKNSVYMKITKTRYLEGFSIVVIVLAVVRCVFPGVAEPRSAKTEEKQVATADSVKEESTPDTTAIRHPRYYRPDGTLVKNRIFSVPCFQTTFPDSNGVQLEMANKYGVSPVQNREEAEHRKKELVYVGSNPYFYVDKLNNSIPYLVPRASVLLQDIGRAFFDSLQTKGIPLHKIIVTSVLRTKDDVQRLRGRNGNATVNSCHLYGTTFDICYNRYKTVEDPDGPSRHKVRNDTLKWVLSEVLRDFRVNRRCYIKYEVHQGCFHLTTR